MQLQEVMKQLEQFGNEQTKKTYTNHGAKEPFFGVKVGDMKTIVTKVKKDHDLSLQLYDTGNADAMYLAGLIADENKITKADLQKWAKDATWYMVSEYAVAGVAAESPHGQELARALARVISNSLPFASNPAALPKLCPTLQNSGRSWCRINH